MTSNYKKIQTEKLEHLQAFEYWVALGDSRNYKEVAKHFHVSEMSIYKWANSFDWQSRLAERNKKLAEKLAKDTDSKYLEYRKKNIERLEKTLQAYEKKLDAGKVDVTQIPDILRVLELQTKLMGLEDHGLADPIEKKSDKPLNDESNNKINNVSFNMTNLGENY